MEIMKVFSSFDNEDERLYSVLMDEDEMYLFSAIGKQILKERKLKKAAKDAWVSGQTKLGDLRIGRRVNSPLTMRDGTAIKDLGLNPLHAKISLKSNNYLRSQAGGQVKKVNGMYPPAFNSGTKGYGGNYAI